MRVVVIQATAPGTPTTPPVETKPILEISYVSKAFGGLRAFNDVNCTVFKGQIKGVIGPNGADRRTGASGLFGRDALAILDF
jgi:ABC-type uncharacterized transport system ATPase subunit